MSTVVSLHDPDRPLIGKAREKALERYRVSVEDLVQRSMNDTFTASFRLPECGDLGVNDAVPIIEAAIQSAAGRFSR